MNIPPKYEDVVAQLEAALGREAALREEAHQDGILRVHYGKQIDSLQQRLTVAEQRAGELEAALKFYAGRDHYSTDDGLNWDSCSGEPSNILWHEDQPWFIEDGSVARAALKPAEADPIQKFINKNPLAKNEAAQALLNRPKRWREPAEEGEGS